MHADGVWIIANARKLSVSEIGMDRLVTDRMHGDGRAALFGLGHRVMPLDQRLKRADAKPAGLVAAVFVIVAQMGHCVSDSTWPSGPLNPQHRAACIKLKRERAVIGKSQTHPLSVRLPSLLGPGRRGKRHRGHTHFSFLEAAFFFFIVS